MLQRTRMAALLAVLLGLTACSAQKEDGASSGLAALPGTDPGLAHVHAVGVDPGDGTLYAASHHGVFRIPASGDAVRIANRYQDTMGFTIIGRNHFLGSGHPDLRENLPSHLDSSKASTAARRGNRCRCLGRPTSTFSASSATESTAMTPPPASC